MEQTFIAIKPDGVLRSLIHKVIEKIENKGYRIVAMKLLIPTQEMAKEHYKEHFGKPFYTRLIWYLTSGPIVAMVVEGENAVFGMRQIIGATDPNQADVGTIRADFAQSMKFNIIHGSDCVENAKREIAIYFNKEEIFSDWDNILEIVKKSEK